MTTRLLGNSREMKYNGLDISDLDIWNRSITLIQ